MAQKAQKIQPKKRLSQEQRALRRTQIIFAAFAVLLIVSMVLSLVVK